MWIVRRATFGSGFSTRDGPSFSFKFKFKSTHRRSSFKFIFYLYSSFRMTSATVTTHGTIILAPSDSSSSHLISTVNRRLYEAV